MAERKPFLLRLDAESHEALQRWASDELRSMNGQIEWILRDAVRRAGRLRAGRRPGSEGPKGRSEG